MPVVAAAVIGGAATVYGASQAKKASNKALKAQDAATDKQIAAQQAALDRITGLNQPFINGGQQSYAALLQQFGIGGQGITGQAPAPALSYDASGNVNRAPAAAPPRIAAGFDPAPGGAKTYGGPAGTSPLQAPAQTSQPDYAAYLAQNPDVAAEAQRVVSTDPNAIGDMNADGKIDAMDYGQYHAQTFHDRPVPNSAPVASQVPQAPAAQDPNAAPNLMNAARPDAQAPPTSFGAAPDLNSFFSNFEADPGAAYRRNQALDGVNAKSAVRGKLRSGDAAKSLATLSSDLASQEYNNWFARQNTLYNNANNQYNNQRAYDTSLWQYGTDRGDRNFNTDRSYQTGREDTRIGNLFDLTRIGVGAAGNVSGAVTNNANQQTGIYGSQANNQADAAYARANANSGMVGSLAGTATNLFANWGGGGGANTPALTGNWARGTW
jgi:hypothetical protein